MVSLRYKCTHDKPAILVQDLIYTKYGVHVNAHIRRVGNPVVHEKPLSD